MLIQNLLDIYNFLPVHSTPLLQVQFIKVDNFPQIQQILYKICIFNDQQQQNQNIAQNYKLLNQFISKEEESLGPKRFRKLVQSVFTIIVQYLLNVLRQQSQQSSTVYFHLTYYRKYCLKYIDTYSSCFGYNLQKWMGMEEKIRQAVVGIKELKKIQEYYNVSIVLNRLCAVIDAISTYYLENIKKAKDLCSKIINTSSIESINVIKSHKQPTTIIKLQLTLCSYTVMRIYQHMGNYELSMFMMNKFFEYAQVNVYYQVGQKYYENAEKFVRVVGKGEMREKEVRVRLTRLEEKIRRIDLTEEEEENKYLAVNRTNKTIKTLSRASSLHTIHQPSTMQKTLSTFNLTQTKHTLSVHKHTNTITSQMQSIQNSQKAIVSLKQSIVKKKQSSTTKLKLTRRGINPNITTTNGFRSNLGRSCSMQFLSNNSNNHNTRSQQQHQQHQQYPPPSTHKQKSPPQPVLRIIKTTKQQKQLKNAKYQQQQLQNLLILKSNNHRNSYRLKQQTLKFLSKQTNQLKQMIKCKNNEINKLQTAKMYLTNQLNLDGLREHIQQSKMRERQLMKQIRFSKWIHLSSLPQVKKIYSYFKTLIIIETYKHKMKVHQMVYGNMLNVPQMRILAVLRQKAQKRNKQVITQVLYNNIKHQVEYINKQLPGHNNEFLHFINIYQTQKGNDGINLQQQLSLQQYNLVKYEPFYYNFSFHQGQLIPFRKQLMSLSLRSIYYVNKLVRKIRRNWLKWENKLRYKRLEVGFKYEYGTEFIRKENQVDNQKFKGKQFVFVSVYLLTVRQIPQQHQHQQQQTNLQTLTSKPFKITYQNITSINHLDKPFTGIRKITSSSSINNQKLFSNSIEKQFEVILQTVSDDKFKNQQFNVRIFHKFIAHQIDLDNQLQLVINTISKSMDTIFMKHITKIVKIQYFIKRTLAKKKFQSRKKQFQIETFLNISVLCTLVVNISSKKAKFFIESILKPQKPNKRKNKNVFSISQSFQHIDINRCPILIRNDPPFRNLQFLSQFKKRLGQSQTFEQMYIRIQKIMKIRMLAKQIVSKKNEIKLFTQFQTQFRKRLCFATIKQEFLFRGKLRSGRTMFMLTVKQFSKVPRPYSLRIFTLDPTTTIPIDGQKIIYNKQKIYLQSKLQIVNEVIDIFGRNEFEIETKIKGDSMTKKPAARISILTGYSFKSGEVNNRQLNDQKGSAGGSNRRLSRGSVFTKFRQKAIIKTQDLQALKKFFQQRNPNELSSPSQSKPSAKLSVVEPVISDPSQDDSNDSKIIESQQINNQ